MCHPYVSPNNVTHQCISLYYAALKNWCYLRVVIYVGSKIGEMTTF